ncbi:hypothetical protein PHMEG_00010713 [Phytophthora megakarya]|uniref:Uncharacterized protein n=1 Tax=Phytophthora megakarya TaxID=4795 RepID=A0A225WEE6_9STRA|nr:hypothetical protein PHMEG_00010713 [Phytophthora megakarya]
MWNDKKIDLIANEEGQNRAKKTLAVTTAKKVNQKQDKNGFNYARKTRMRCDVWALTVCG